MADRAHIRFVDPDWVVIKKYSSETGKYILETGELTQPVVLGDVYGNDRIVPVAVVTNDTSTGGETVSTAVETVDQTQVTRTVTVRDKTAAEIDAEKDAILANLDIASRDELYALAIVVKGALSLMYQTTGNYNNLTQFKNAFEANEDTITNAQFKTFLKDRLG